MRQQKYYNNKQIRPMVQNRRDADQLISASFKAFLLLGAMALRDEFGFGNARMSRWIVKMHDLLDSYKRGYVSIQDLHDTILEETGIDVNGLEL